MSELLPDLLERVVEQVQDTRPIAALDLETTGINPEIDRIVELTIIRFDPATGRVSGLETRVNPGVPIPVEASAVHHITDADVAGAPTFSAIAARVHELLTGADLIGFHHKRFDVRLIAAELARYGLPNPMTDARLIDVGQIFMQREPRTLEAAVKYFCGGTHEGAHGTTADVVATLQVLLAQFARYDDLPRAIDALDAIGRDTSWIDHEGKIAWRGGKACINFGKFQGMPLERCREKGRDGDDLRGFLAWMLVKDFPTDTKDIVGAVLRGEYPQLPAPVAAGS